MSHYQNLAKGQGHLPPHSPAAESAALGCILDQADTGENGNAVSMLTALDQSDFYEYRHQTLYSTLHDLHQDGKPLDTITVQQYLKDTRQLENAGGLAYLSSLPDKGTPASFSSYMDILRDKALRRKIVSLAAEMGQLARDGGMKTSELREKFANVVGRAMTNDEREEKWIRFYTPSECRNYTPPTGHVLVGNCHITHGAVAVIGGAPSVGKSRAGIALAVAGATGGAWLGLKVHVRFKTLIIQNENSRSRLKQDFTDIADTEVDSYIRVSEPPANGMAFDRQEFRAAVAWHINEFKPDVVILDPWNSAARDDKQKDYLETFEAIQEVLPKADDAPALVIVAHTRKPRADERASGRALLNLLAGSYVLGSVPRCVFVMQSASDDTTENRIVWTCCKNNDGELGQRSSWYRRNGLFEPCESFDWDAFDAVGDERRMVTLADLEALFDGGNRRLEKGKAVAELMESTGLKKSACYAALKPDGKFAANLSENGGLIVFKA